MRILLDECVTKRLKPYLHGFEVYTVSEMKWNGIKNGKLMALCIENNFDLIWTIDKNLMFQQNLDKNSLSIVILNSLTSKLKNFEKHKAYIIER